MTGRRATLREGLRRRRPDRGSLLGDRKHGTAGQRRVRGARHPAFDDRELAAGREGLGADQTEVDGVGAGDVGNRESRDRVQNGLGFLPHLLGRDRIKLVIGRVLRSCGAKRGAELESETRQDRFASRLASLVRLALEHSMFADDHRRYRRRRRAR